VCHARELRTVRRSAQHVHRAEATVHRAVTVGVFDSRVPQPFPRPLLVCDYCSWGGTDQETRPQSYL